jgi:hypothetical protein
MCSLSRSGWYENALHEARLATSEDIILTESIKAWVASLSKGDDAVVRL